MATTAWAGAVSVIASAQESSLKMVEQKTQSRLEEIAGGVKGVAGIVVEDLGGPSRFAVDADREFAVERSLQRGCSVFDEIRAGERGGRGQIFIVG